MILKEFSMELLEEVFKIKKYIILWRIVIPGKISKLKLL